jgi:hypothetical protein
MSLKHTQNHIQCPSAISDLQIRSEPGFAYSPIEDILLERPVLCRAV